MFIDTLTFVDHFYGLSEKMEQRGKKYYTTILTCTPTSPPAASKNGSYHDHPIKHMFVCVLEYIWFIRIGTSILVYVIDRYFTGLQEQFLENTNNHLLYCFYFIIT